MDEEITEEEKKALKEYFGYPIPEEKYNIHTFLHKVAISADTTKTGFLTEEEIGLPKIPVRTSKELALISGKIMGNDFFKDYFDKKSEIITATSLSKDAKLLSLAVLTQKEIKDITPQRKANKGWFKRKTPEDQIVNV